MYTIRMLLLASVLALPVAAPAFTVDDRSGSRSDASNFTDPDDAQPTGVGIHYTGNGQLSGNAPGGLSVTQGGSAPGTLSGMEGRPCSFDNPCTSRLR